MVRTLVCAAVLAFAHAFAAAQRIPEAQVANVWQDGLRQSQINAVESLVAHFDDTDRWMVYAAVVRSREYNAESYISGDPLTQMKVLANVRTRLSVDDTKRFNTTWGHMTRAQQSRFVKLLRSIQTGA